MKVKFANRIYEVLFTKKLAGLTMYAVEDEPNHIDWLINVEVVDAEKKELKKIEQKLANSTKTCKNDTLLGLLQKMPSCITVDGVDYYFVMKKTSIYIAYYACYKGNGEEGLCHGIFGITAHSPIDLLTEMLEILKEKGLLK